MRLFIAIDIPNEIKQKIKEAFLYARDSLEFARFTEPERLHITLVFLGETEESLLKKTEDAIESVSRLYRGGIIKINNVIIGPDENRARMLWLKLDESSHKYLESISNELKKELKSRGIPFDNNHEIFNGHITLAKFDQSWQQKYEGKNDRGKSGDIRLIKEFLPESFEASFGSKAITLFSSVVKDGQRFYESLFESNFKE